jgi:uncharacterized protein
VIFVDSSFWIAIRTPRDDHHAEAVALLERCGGGSLCTSNHVRGETWTFLRRRRGHGAAVHFLEVLERTSRLQVLSVGDELEAQALSWLLRHDEREYSLVDVTSFALMRSLRIKRALAFDGYFAAAGFDELRA